MRVDEGAGAKAAELDARKEAPPRKRFGEALRQASRTGRQGTLAEATPAAPGRAAAARRSAADRGDEALRLRRDAFGEEARLAAPPPPAAPARALDAVTTPELRALVRTLPLAIQASGVRDGAPLALSFGRSLDVELRPSPRGLELVLRPEPRLARASHAEVRGLVAALAEKGIAVARAEVRVRGTAAGCDRRVDLGAGLR